MRGRKVAHKNRRSLAHPLILTAAALWLALTVLALAGIQPAAASSRQASSPGIAQAAGTPSDTPVPTTPPTQAPPTATDTPPPADTPTDTPVPADTPADTPTDTPAPVDNGGGGGGGAGGGGGTGPATGGPQVTRVVLSQPTVAAGNDNAVPGLAGATFGSNGLLLATTMSCVVGLLGLTVAGIALAVLMRRGYGPFLSALLRGKRAGTKQDLAGATDTDDFQTHSAYMPATSRGGNGNMADERYAPDSYGSYGRNGQRSGQRSPSATRSRANRR